MSATNYYMLSLFIFVISLPGYLKADSNSRRFLKGNYKYLILLALFASFVDTLSSNMGRWLSILNITNSLIEKWLPTSLYIIEECGVLFVIILICTWLFGITLKTEILNLKS